MLFIKPIKIENIARKLLIESQAIRKLFYDQVTESFGRLKGIEKTLLG